MAAAIQYELATAGYSGAVVTNIPSASSYLFNVDFSGANSGSDQPMIAITSLTPGVNPSVTEWQKGESAPPPQSTASDGNGDNIVVWSSDDPASPGVYAKISGVAWTTTTPRTSVVTAGSEILIAPYAGTRNISGVATSFTDASSVSVAMDAAGDFVVTWSEQDNGDWNVWYRRFSAGGTALGSAHMANTITDDVQRYSAVGMDSAGDFVITWQSLNEDGDGYGIYAKRYDSAGNPTTVQGAPGEFRVNDTTPNNQMYPSIAMNASGTYVISWTGYGQNGDQPYQSSVYAKQYAAGGTGGGASQFNITLKFDGGLTASQEAVFEIAAQTWESIIVGDIPDVKTPTGTIDDILIDASGIAIDGVGGILGQTEDTGLRKGSDLPYAAIMQFDTADLAALQASGQLVEVITHEMAHALGFGTIWTDLNLLSGAGTSDPEFTGAGATAEYDKAFNTNAKSVPVEAGGGAGTADSHWRESVFGNELMTGWLNPGINPLSRMTAASMGDLGYKVNVDAANLLSDLGSTSLVGVNGTDRILSGPVTYATPMTSASSGSSEFQVSPPSTGDQKWSSVGIDSAGNFVVSWTSNNQDGGGNGPDSTGGGGNGIYAQRYSAAGAKVGGEFLVNSYTANNQQYSKVAMDAAGDFTIVWESFQDRPTYNSTGSGDQADSPNSYGIYGQSYVRASQIGKPLADGSVATGPDGELHAEFQVNTTQEGDQRYPGIAMDPNGDFVVVWSGVGTQTGQSDTQGVFEQRYDMPADTTGPQVVATFDLKPDTTTLLPVNNGDTLAATTDPTTNAVDPTTQVRQFVVTFTEPMMATGTNSPLNTANWTLSLNGKVVTGAIASVAAYSGLPNSYLVTFDGNTGVAGTQPLSAGAYTLTLSDTTEDKFKNALDGNNDGLPGGAFTRTFVVTTPGGGGGGGGGGGTNPAPGPGTPPSNTDDSAISSIPAYARPVVAGDAAGDYVVVWADEAGEVMAQIYDATGAVKKAAFRVNTQQNVAEDFSPGTPMYAVSDVARRICDVAMDSAGDFVVVWSGYGSADAEGVYASVFSVTGVLKTSEFLVNQTLLQAQYQPSVAMDYAGDFVITWTSYGQDGDRQGVFGRRYNSAGAATSNEFQVNTTGADKQDESSVAMDKNGDFTVVWESYGQDGNMWGIFGQRYNAAGAKQGGEFQVNQYTTDKQMDPQVAMDQNGDFVVAWTSFGQGSLGYGIYDRRYNPSGAAVTGDTRVSSVDPNWQGQITPDVSMDAKGDYVVTWAAYGQEQLGGATGTTEDYGVFTHMYNSDGSEYTDPNTNQVLGEFRINATMYGDQSVPAVGMAQNGNCAYAWLGTGNFGGDVYQRDVGWGSVILGTTVPQNVTLSGGATIGLFSPLASTFYLRNANSTGSATSTFAYGPAGSGWITLVGDWNGDGIDTIGLYDPSTSRFYLRGSNTTGIANITFQYGPAGAGWKPLVGDWNGDGIDTIGLYDPKASKFYLRNTNTTGIANATFGYGPAGGGWTPVVGDWNGDGKDTIGLYSPAASKFYLRDANTTGAANLTFAYGPAGGGWTPVVGDWDGNGTVTVGLYNSATGKFYERNTNTTGVANSMFSYGPANAGWVPLAGNWIGVMNMTAAAPALATSSCPC